MSLSCAVSEIYVENRGFELTPPLFGTPVGVISLECRRGFFGIRKPGSLGYHGVVCVILGSATFVQLRLVTDRQTDRQTDVRTSDSEFNVC